MSDFAEKTVKTYVYQGLGFPVELHNVKMIEIGGEYHPNIDVRKIAAGIALEMLSSPKTVLTGDQLAFIRRDHLDMDESKFAKLLKASEADVKKWEAASDKPANMNAEAESFLKQKIKPQEKLVSKQGMFGDSSKKRPHTPDVSNKNKENQDPNIKKRRT